MNRNTVVLDEEPRPIPAFTQEQIEVTVPSLLQPGPRPKRRRRKHEVDSNYTEDGSNGQDYDPQQSSNRSHKEKPKKGAKCFKIPPVETACAVRLIPDIYESVMSLISAAQPNAPFDKYSIQNLIITHVLDTKTYNRKDTAFGDIVTACTQIILNDKQGQFTSPSFNSRFMDDFTRWRDPTSDAEVIRRYHQLMDSEVEKQKRSYRTDIRASYTWTKQALEKFKIAFKKYGYGPTANKKIAEEIGQGIHANHVAYFKIRLRRLFDFRPIKEIVDSEAWEMLKAHAPSDDVEEASRTQAEATAPTQNNDTANDAGSVTDSIPSSTPTVPPPMESSVSSASSASSVAPVPSVSSVTQSDTYAPKPVKRRRQRPLYPLESIAVNRPRRTKAQNIVEIVDLDDEEYTQNPLRNPATRNEAIVLDDDIMEVSPSTEPIALDDEDPPFQQVTSAKPSTSQDGLMNLDSGTKCVPVEPGQSPSLSLAEAPMPNSLANDIPKQSESVGENREEVETTHGSHSEDTALVSAQQELNNTTQCHESKEQVANPSLGTEGLEQGSNYQQLDVTIKGSDNEVVHCDPIQTYELPAPENLTNKEDKNNNSVQDPTIFPLSDHKATSSENLPTAPASSINEDRVEVPQLPDSSTQVDLHSSTVPSTSSSQQIEPPQIANSTSQNQPSDSSLTDSTQSICPDAKNMENDESSDEVIELGEEPLPIAVRKRVRSSRKNYSPHPTSLLISSSYRPSLLKEVTQQKKRRKVTPSNNETNCDQ